MIDCSVPWPGVLGGARLVKTWSGDTILPVFYDRPGGIPDAGHLGASGEGQFLFFQRLRFMLIASSIFKAYDIRGVINVTLDGAVVERIGRALGARAADAGHTCFVVGRDGRPSSPELSAALARGLIAVGMDVIDIGQVTTPMVYFAILHLGTHCGVMVTGSHNPPEYNGLKPVIGDRPVYGECLAEVGRQAIAGSARSSARPGELRYENIRSAYIKRILGDVKLVAPLRVVVDAGSGVGGAIAPDLYRSMGAQVHELYCEVDGRFPHHHPDPSQPANLRELIAVLQGGGHDIGLAFDGDADRLGVVTARGRIIYPDRLLMLFAEDVLMRHPGGRVIYDVKSTRHLESWIHDRGGVPEISATGHSVLKARMLESGAPLAGELSGHIFFGDRWYGFDDGVYAGARLLELLSRARASGRDLDAVFDAIPDALSTPELHWSLPEGEAAEVVRLLQRTAHFSQAVRMLDMDGVRVEYHDGFGLARASNTTPVLVLRFEADDVTALARIQEDFRGALLAIRPGAALPF